MVGALKVVLVGLLLLLLTTTTYFLSKVPLGSWSLVVALTIASVKSVAIVLWYMHLSERPGGSYLAGLTGIIFIGLMISVILLEQNNRFLPTLPPGPFGVAPPRQSVQAPPGP